MILFDSNKLSVKYVYISKITTSYIYVVCNKDMTTYDSGIKAIHFGNNVKKIKIDQSVYFRYMQNNFIKEFSEPKLATLNLYGNDIVSIEVKAFSYSLDKQISDEDWVSVFDKSIPLIKKKVNSLDNICYINGDSIYWMDEENEKTSLKLNEEGSFLLCHAHAINLYKIGTQKIVKSLNDLNESVDYEIGEDDTVLQIHLGKLLAYIPNPNSPKEDQIVAYSPFLEKRKVKSKSGKIKEISVDEYAIYSLNSDVNKTFVNIDFLLSSAKTIAELYGYHHVEFLNIESILKKNNITTLYQIPENLRKSIPINVSAETCVSWIMGFIYREKDLNNIRKLNKIFKRTINRNIVKSKDIELIEKNNVVKDIPLRSERLKKEIEYSKNKYINKSA